MSGWKPGWNVAKIDEQLRVGNVPIRPEILLHLGQAIQLLVIQMYELRCQMVPEYIERGLPQIVTAPREVSEVRGECDYQKERITIHITPDWTDSQATSLHELAHWLRPGKGHMAAWLDEITVLFKMAGIEHKDPMDWLATR